MRKETAPESLIGKPLFDQFYWNDDRSMAESMRTVLKRIILTIAAVLFCIGIGAGTVGNLSHRSYLIAFLIAIFLAVLSLLFWKRFPGASASLDRFEPAVICILISTVCLLLNGAWVFCFHPVQAPDYRTFYEAAVNLSEGVELANKDYIAMFPHILGYSAFLSLFLRLLGKSIMTAAVVNVLLTAGSCVLIYMLSLHWTGKRTAAAYAGMLWTICPSKLLYNTMALSEPYYTFLLLLFFMLTSLVFDLGQPAASDNLNAGKKERPVLRAVLLGMFCGLILALVNSARPIGVIPIIAFLIWRLLLRRRSRRKEMRRASIAYLLVLLVAYVSVGRVWNSYAAARLEQTPASVPGYSIYVGFNPETQGSYSDADMELLQSRYAGEYNRDAEAAQRSMLDSAGERIHENKKDIPSMMVHKLGTLLGHDEGGAFYSRENLSERSYALWCVACNVWYYYVCILAAFGGFVLWKEKRGDSSWLIPLCIVGVILAQLMVEVAARYHYCLIPMLVLMASFWFGVKEKTGSGSAAR